MYEKQNPIIQEDGHRCSLDSNFEAYGVAIYDCYESIDGTLWAGNGEYGSQINFCPVCGYEAKVKVKL